MSIRSEISRIQDAKNLLKGGIENTFQVSVSSSDRLDSYINYFPAIYPTPPTQNGVYIKYTDGTYSNWDSLLALKTPVGVAIKTDNCAYTLHPNAYDGAYGPRGTCWYSNVSRYSDGIYHYDGQATNDYVLAVANASSAPAFFNARNAIFADNSTGYLLAAGELWAAVLNLSSVNYALNLIGGEQIGDVYYRSCTGCGKEGVGLVVLPSYGCNTTYSDISRPTRVGTNF